MTNRMTDTSGFEEVPSELEQALQQVPEYTAEAHKTSKEEDPLATPYNG